MRVSELARTAEVTPDLVRYYTRIGLLHPRKDGYNGYRRFNRADLGRLRFVLQAKRLGFKLSEVERIVSMADHGHTPCPVVREIVQERIVETRQRLDEITVLQLRLERALSLWEEMPDGGPDGDQVCALIEATSEVPFPDA